MEKRIQPETNNLVSVGIPVRNGGHWIEESLNQLVAQTHQNLEIIISDNNSSDNTSEVCRAFALRDSRVHYFKQKVTLPAMENFRYVFDRACSEFFMWAAHDDRHSLNFVERTLQTLLDNESACLAFPNLAIFHEVSDWRSATPTPYDFQCDGSVHFWKGLVRREYIRAGFLHIYGLIRKDALAGYKWPKIEISADKPLLIYLWRRGSFVKTEGAVFYCYKPLQKKTQTERAIAVSGKGMRQLPYTRLSWHCARAAYTAEKMEHRNRSAILLFGLLWFLEMKRKTRKIIKSFRRSVKRFYKSVRSWLAHL